ncbi:MAG: GH25 family lysozyme [Lachnospira eligens]
MAHTSSHLQLRNREAIEEADYVLDIIKPYRITYPVVIDFEEISGDSYRQENLTTEELTDIIIAFCDKIEKAGYKPMIYSNLKGFVGRLDLTRLEKYEKWFAYYSDTPYFPYEFSIWQYTESAKLDGVSGNTIDLNISFKDYN